MEEALRVVEEHDQHEADARKSQSLIRLLPCMHIMCSHNYCFYLFLKNMKCEKCPACQQVIAAYRVLPKTIDYADEADLEEHSY
jgi:hypothetical protein